jgi:hypothetical protein
MKNPEIHNFSASVKMGKAVVGTPVASLGVTPERSALAKPRPSAGYARAGIGRTLGWSRQSARSGAGSSGADGGSLSSVARTRQCRRDGVDALVRIAATLSLVPGGFAGWCAIRWASAPRMRSRCPTGSVIHSRCGPGSNLSLLWQGPGGQQSSLCGASRSSPRSRLPHRHSSARRIKFARSAVPFTYRATAC